VSPKARLAQRSEPEQAERLLLNKIENADFGKNAESGIF
jgi:hypothetical protein